ncbi:MAG: hypothetical protein PHG06_17525 [Parabacteroides sp.]|nr:hypothetical protein [Parabacteroides sp.]
MIRKAKLEDAKAITDIYNEYVMNSVVTFEAEPLSEEAMRLRMERMIPRFPYFVDVQEMSWILNFCYRKINN